MDAEKIINAIEKAKKQSEEYAQDRIIIPFKEVDMILAMLKEREAVVRCGDCINCIREPNGELYCDILAIGYEPLGSKKVTEDWFCADGAGRQ